VDTNGADQAKLMPLNHKHSVKLEPYMPQDTKPKKNKIPIIEESFDKRIIKTQNPPKKQQQA